MVGGPVRQPYAGVDFVPQSGIYVRLQHTNEGEERLREIKRSPHASYAAERARGI
jgi:hypothetical protein